MNPPNILILDKTGRPQQWCQWQTAATLYAKNSVLWTLGDVAMQVRGGINRCTAARSEIAVHSIVAVNGYAKNARPQAAPLTNKTLFRRDGNICMYCGKAFSDGELTRDHIIPTSRGGKDVWMNVAAACKRCNNSKGNKLLEECGMTLLALPYVPNHAEYLALINTRNILADQMSFLGQQFSKNFRTS